MKVNSLCWYFLPQSNPPETVMRVLWIMFQDDLQKAAIAPRNLQFSKANRDRVCFSNALHFHIYLNIYSNHNSSSHSPYSAYEDVLACLLYLYICILIQTSSWFCKCMFATYLFTAFVAHCTFLSLVHIQEVCTFTYFLRFHTTSFL